MFTHCDACLSNNALTESVATLAGNCLKYHSSKKEIWKHSEAEDPGTGQANDEKSSGLCVPVLSTDLQGVTISETFDTSDLHHSFLSAILEQKYDMLLPSILLMTEI